MKADSVHTADTLGEANVLKWGQCGEERGARWFVGLKGLSSL